MNTAKKNEIEEVEKVCNQVIANKILDLAESKGETLGVL